MHEAILGILNELDDLTRATEYTMQMLEPLRVLQVRQPMLIVGRMHAIAQLGKHQLATYIHTAMGV